MIKKRHNKDVVERPRKNKAAAPAKPPQKTKPDPVNQPQKQATAPDALPPGAWVLPWMPPITGGVNNATFVLAWLIGAQLADSGPAAHYQRNVDGDVHIAIKRVKLAELLGLTAEEVGEAIEGLREMGLVTTKVREDGGTKLTFFKLDLHAISAAKNKVSTNKEEAP
jgi:hypothetical protein